jgi:hypothetical protein
MLCDLLYPRAALALYSSDPTAPSCPTFGAEWIEGNFPIVQGPAALLSSLHGHRMVSCARRRRNELIFWASSEEDAPFPSLQPRALEVVRPLRFSSGPPHPFSRTYVDDVSLDGPRVLFTCYKGESWNGTVVYTRQVLCSVWGSLQPSS